MQRSGAQVGRVGPCNKELCASATVYGRLKQPRRWVEVWVGGGAVVSLVARNASFNAVAAVKTVQTSPGSLSLLRVESSAYNIAYFQIGENAPVGSQRNAVILDDLRVSEADPNAKPDFTLSWTPLLPGQDLSVPIPGQVTTKVAISRFNGSSGDIALSGSSTSNPAFPNTIGVTVKISPDKASTSATSVFVTLTATANAVVPDKARLIVTGSPGGASVGPADQTVGIPLDGRLSNVDFLVTGIEVNQGIQVQHTPYYSGSVTPDFCKVFTGTADAPEICAGTLFDAKKCETLPSLPPRDMANLSEPILYKVDDRAEAPQWLLDPMATQAQATGVALVAGRRTIVRVFVTMFGPSGKTSPRPGCTFTGDASASSSPLGLRPSLLPSSSGAARVRSSRVRSARTPRRAYTFTLPDSWTEGSIELRAELVPDDVVFGAGGECGSATCVANNTLTLDQVGFTKLGYTTITPVEAYLTGKAPVLLTPGEAFDDARFFMPGRTYFTGGSESVYAAVIVIDDIVNLFSFPLLVAFLHRGRRGAKGRDL